MNTDICKAIAGRRVLEIWYDGGTRIVEPHCHGFSTAGNEVVRAYQSSGYSNSGERSAWKMLKVAEIGSLKETGAVFTQNRPGYNPQDKGIASVHCHV